MTQNGPSAKIGHMPSLPPPSLQEWLAETSGVLVPGVDESGLIFQYELWHANEDGSERLKVIRIEDRREDLEALPAALAMELYRTCEQHALTLPSGMPLRYAVRAFRGKDDVIPEAVHYVTLAGSLLSVTNGTGVAAERGQLIRHNETLHNMMMQLVQGVAGRLSRDLEAERDARIASERRYGEVLLLREELIDRKHERELEIARENNAAERQKALLEMLSSFAPVILSKLASAKPGEEAAVKAAMLRDQAVSRIVNGLGAEEIGKLATMMKPETQAAFLALIEAYGEQKQEARQGEKTGN